MSRVDGSKILILRVKLQIFPAVFVDIRPQFISRLFEESALLEEFNYLCVFVEELLQVGLEVGYRIIPLVDKNQGGELLGRIKGVRKKLSQDLGFLMPTVPESEYSIHARRLFPACLALFGFGLPVLG